MMASRTEALLVLAKYAARECLRPTAMEFDEGDYRHLYFESTGRWPWLFLERAHDLAKHGLCPPPSEFTIETDYGPLTIRRREAQAERTSEPSSSPGAVKGSIAAKDPP